jgi:putative heme-binding domain-containing protein
LELVKDGKLPADLNFSAANILHVSADQGIRNQAAQHLQLPVTVGANPLPPLAELIKQQGNHERGQQIFSTTGTCTQCHVVNGQGKQVGPDLSEIGSKLSKEAMYVSILDPSAGISHNYESYVAVLDDGNVITGILISETDQEITLKTAEAIERKIERESIEEIKKQTISLMPADLQKTMTAEQLVDVVEYLTTLKKK